MPPYNFPIEQPIPANTQNKRFEPETPAEPATQPAKPAQNERFEPSGPNPFQKIAIIIVLLLASIAFSLSWNSSPMQERTELDPAGHLLRNTHPGTHV